MKTRHVLQPGLIGQAAAEEPKTITNSIGLEMVLIPAGSFIMGSEDGDEDEAPVHKVTISKPFYLGIV